MQLKRWAVWSAPIFDTRVPGQSSRHLRRSLSRMMGVAHVHQMCHVGMDEAARPACVNGQLAAAPGGSSNTVAEARHGWMLQGAAEQQAQPHAA